MSSVLAVTLARGGSKGVPGKHTRMLCGKPVIAWTIEEVLKSKLIDDYVVSSDSDEILDIALSYGVRVILRPKELAQDTTPTLPALKHAITRSMPAEYIAEIRATSPLKTVEDIDGAIQMMIDKQPSSVIGVTEVGDGHPMRLKFINRTGMLRDFFPEPPSGRRQDCKPKAYIRNGTMYVLKMPVEKLFGHTESIAYIMPADRSVNIDTEIDYKLCEILMKERQQCFG